VLLASMPSTRGPAFASSAILAIVVKPTSMNARPALVLVVLTVTILSTLTVARSVLMVLPTLRHATSISMNARPTLVSWVALVSMV
jgi:hypothetical protein